MNWEEPTLAASDLSGMTSRTLVMIGDDDEVVLEHAIAMYRALSDAELAVGPGTSHGLLHEKPTLCDGGHGLGCQEAHGEDEFHLGPGGFWLG